jgi:hypothetical protein
MSMASNKKPYTIHKTDILLNKANLKKIIDSKGISYMELYEKIRDKYGLDLSYKGFMTLLSNRSTWKLIYAWCIVEVLMIDFKEIFELVEINIDEKKKEKELWKKNYQNK